MKIGLVLAQTPGYSETFFRSMIKGLQRNGVEISLYVETKKKDFDLCPVYESPKVYANPIVQSWYFIKEFIFLLPYISEVRKFKISEQKTGTRGVNLLKNIYLNAHILKAKLDWLHYGFATQAMGRETLAKAINAKMAVSLRGFDINVYPIKNPGCYINLWRYVDKVHSVSEYLLRKAIDIGLSKETPWTIITPAVSLEKILFQKNMKASEEIKIFTIARPNWIKGLETAIDAMRLLKKRNFKFKYYIIGDKDSEESDYYKFMIYELGLTNDVVFLGKQSHQKTMEYLRNADLYIQPSLNEGYCNAVLEAQSLGKLCIVTNAGGLTENIIHGETGWVVPKYSPELLSEQIIKVFSLSSAEKIKISKNAITRVSKEFNIQKQESEFLHFYTL